MIDNIKIVITGPKASGKTRLMIDLLKSFDDKGIKAIISDAEEHAIFIKGNYK